MSLSMSNVAASSENLDSQSSHYSTGYVANI